MPPATDPHVGEPTWPSRRLAARSVWPLATGSGVTVAVLGEAVEPGNGQLTPSVRPTVQIIEPEFVNPPAITADCSGVGTIVAGLIAAQPDRDRTTEVAGLAPGAQVLPIAVGEAPLGQAATSTAKDLTAAFAAALKAKARVICVTASTTQDTPALRAAVATAIEADVLVISAGVVDKDSVGPTFPTAYPDVLGVVGVDEFDRPVPGTDAGPYVDVAAPSAQMLSTGVTRDRPAALAHRLLPSHPTAGAAFVAATAALIRQTYPDATWLEVASRIVLTADPVSGDVTWGVVNPYRAVSAAALPTSVQQNRAPARLVPMTPAPGVAPSTQVRAALIAGGGIGVAVAALALGAALRAGNRRRWRAGQERQVPDDLDPVSEPAVSRPSAMA